MRRGKAGARAHDAPTIGIVQPQMPSSGATHREASQDHSGRINPLEALDSLIAAKEMADRFQDVGLAGPAIGVVAAAGDVDLDEGVVGLFAVSLEIGYFRVTPIATVQDDVGAPYLIASILVFVFAE